MPLVWQALALSLGAAIALGIARFSYALLLPPMQADMQWSFAQAGALNTSIGLGYLLGALASAWVGRRLADQRTFLGACVCTSLLMFAPGFGLSFDALLAVRAACGFFSALIFVSGGMLASRLASAHPAQAGLMLGLYYSGTGLGIVASAVVVPAALGFAGDTAELAAATTASGWPGAWFALGGAALLCTALAWPLVAKMAAPAPLQTTLRADAGAPPMHRYALLLTAYALFGVGYIGYMTFVIALLRSSGLAEAVDAPFFVLLGLATALSGKVWAGALQRARGGGAFSLFCALLSVATLMPAVSSLPLVVLVSGVLFGGTFLSVVASTTAFVRHNLPVASWPAGIGAFTVVFAIGQIIGPVLLGAISDDVGLARGFVYSAAVLLLASLLALGQKALASK